MGTRWTLGGKFGRYDFLLRGEMLIVALFIVGFFEWALVFFTNWPKQVNIAYARYIPSDVKGS